MNDIAVDYVPQPYKLKWLFCNCCGSEQAASFIPDTVLDGFATLAMRPE